MRNLAACPTLLMPLISTITASNNSRNTPLWVQGHPGPDALMDLCMGHERRLYTLDVSSDPCEGPVPGPVLSPFLREEVPWDGSDNQVHPSL